MLYPRRTRIVATIGPASCSPENIERLFCSGVNVFRLNFSHGEHATHKEVYDNIRKLENKYNRKTCILADMQGPKLRVGTFENTKEILKQGDTFTFDLNPELGNSKRVQLPHPEIIKAADVGSNLLVDDGKLKFKVVSKGSDFLETEVIIGGAISNRKGVNVPEAILPIPALPPKDLKDLDFSLQLGVDWIALSFVQTPKDVLEAKEIIKGRAKVLAKIEKPQAVEQLEEIVEVADAIMVARGDLAVEAGHENVPMMCRQMVQVCREFGKPIVIATQMLESMTENATPTRAEVSDVATAVYLGTDAVMLSAESASGKYPVEAVQMMNNIIVKTESDPCFFDFAYDPQISGLGENAESIGMSLQSITANENVPVVIIDSDFETLKAMSKYRLQADLLFLAKDEQTSRQASLIYGVSSTTKKLPNALDSSSIKEFVMAHRFDASCVNNADCASQCSKDYAERKPSVVLVKSEDGKITCTMFEMKAC